MITIDASQLRQADKVLQHIKGGTPRALNAAINRTLSGMRTDMTQRVRQTYNIKAGDVRSSLKIRKSSLQTLRGEVQSTGSPMRLIKFRVSPATPAPGRRKPIKAAVKKGSLKPVSGAFVAQMRSGTIGVFSRKTSRRLPINMLYGPGVPTMLNEPEVNKFIQDKAEERLSQRFDHEVRRLLVVKVK